MVSLPLQHILIVVQQLVPSNVHLCKYIRSLWLSCWYLQFLSVTSSREMGHQQHGHDRCLSEHIQAIAELRPALHSPCIMNPESPNIDTPISSISVK
jgi:hypothetical protein